jgi:hypothetical protein
MAVLECHNQVDDRAYYRGKSCFHRVAFASRKRQRATQQAIQARFTQLITRLLSRPQRGLVDQSPVSRAAILTTPRTKLLTWPHKSTVEPSPTSRASRSHSPVTEEPPQSSRQLANRASGSYDAPAWLRGLGLLRTAPAGTARRSHESRFIVVSEWGWLGATGRQELDNIAKARVALRLPDLPELLGGDT